MNAKRSRISDKLMAFNKTIVRNSVLSLLVLVFVLIPFFRKIPSLYSYIAGVFCVVGGFKAVLDFAFGLSMKLGYSDYYSNKERNVAWRFLLLVGGIGFIILGLVGIFVWNV